MKKILLLLLMILSIISCNGESSSRDQKNEFCLSNWTSVSSNLPRNFPELSNCITSSYKQANVFVIAYPSNRNIEETAKIISEYYGENYRLSGNQYSIGTGYNFKGIVYEENIEGINFTYVGIRL